MVAYRAVQEEYHDHDLGVYTAFGVCAYQIIEQQQEQVAYIPDVFLSTETAQHFVEICNRLQLEIIHLREVIEDAIL